MDIAVRMIALQAKGCPRLLGNPQKQGERCGADSSLEPPEGTNRVRTLISDWGL